MALDKTLQKKNAGQKSLSILAPKIWSKINSFIKNVKSLSSLMHVLRTIFYFICKANANNYILMIDIIIDIIKLA